MALNTEASFFSMPSSPNGKDAPYVPNGCFGNENFDSSNLLSPLPINSGSALDPRLLNQSRAINYYQPGYPAWQQYSTGHPSQVPYLNAQHNTFTQPAGNENNSHAKQQYPASHLSQQPCSNSQNPFSQPATIELSNSNRSRPASFSSAEDQLPEPSPADLNHNYVYNLLKSSYEGGFQLRAFEFQKDPTNYKYLLEKHRTVFYKPSKVASIIIQHEFHRTNSLSIKGTRLAELAKDAAEVFSPEIAESFYTNAGETGYLQRAYQALRGKEIAIKNIVPRQTKKSNAAAQAISSDNLKEFEKLIESNNEDLLIKWKQISCAEKEKEFKGKSVSHILRKFPNLSALEGYVLIESDFYELNPASPRHRDLQQKFLILARKLISLGKTKSFVEAKALLHENKVIKNEEHEVNLALMLLPRIFKQTTAVQKTKKGGTSWSPKRNEVADSFIYHVKNTSESDIEGEIEEVHRKLNCVYLDHKELLGPCVIVFGKNLFDVTCAYLVIEELKIKFSSLFSAVDICFKIFKALHQRFPKPTAHVWQTLESELYSIPATQHTGVKELIVQLSKY